MPLVVRPSGTRWWSAWPRAFVSTMSAQPDHRAPAAADHATVHVQRPVVLVDRWPPVDRSTSMIATCACRRFRCHLALAGSAVTPCGAAQVTCRTPPPASAGVRPLGVEVLSGRRRASSVPAAAPLVDALNLGVLDGADARAGRSSAMQPWPTFTAQIWIESPVESQTGGHGGSSTRSSCRSWTMSAAVGPMCCAASPRSAPRSGRRPLRRP